MSNVPDTGENPGKQAMWMVMTVRARLDKKLSMVVQAIVEFHMEREVKEQEQDDFSMQDDDDWSMPDDDIYTLDDWLVRRGVE